MKLNCLLLADQNPELVRQHLSSSKLEVADIVFTDSLARALATLNERPVDVVLLDLNLSDSKSIDTLTVLRKATGTVIIVLADDNEELLAVQAIRRGADDFVVKSKLNAESLRASILASLTRHDIRLTQCRLNRTMCELEKMAGINE